MVFPAVTPHDTNLVPLKVLTIHKMFFCRQRMYLGRSATKDKEAAGALVSRCLFLIGLDL
jgi:hypothetical protein